MCLPLTARQAEPHVEIEVVVAGQTGVGKSSLINMVLGLPDHSDAAAVVSNDALPCTAQTTPYMTSLGTGLQCRLWDTRGLGEAVDANDRSFMPRMVSQLRLLASQQARELKRTLRDRTNNATPILIWCIDAAKINIPIHWQKFREVYVEYCRRNVVPVIVVTRLTPRVIGWQTKCRDQLRELSLGRTDPMGIPLLAVRMYHNPSEYTEDSRALRDLILGLTTH